MNGTTVILLNGMANNALSTCSWKETSLVYKDEHVNK